MNSTGKLPISRGRTDWHPFASTIFNELAGLLEEWMSAKRKHIANGQMVDALQRDIALVGGLPLAGDQSGLAFEFG